MKKINIRHLVILLMIAFIASASFYFYTETHGYPWKHAEVKKEAVDL